MTARQSVTISRDTGGQVQLGQPAAARPGPVAGGPVIAVVGGDRVDPVAQLGAEPDQAGPVPQQRPELAHLRRRDPRLGQQVRAQQLRQDRGVDLVVLQPRRGDRLAPQRVHQVRLEAVVLEQLRPASPSRTRPRTPPACPAGRSPISRSIGSEPFTTFRLSCTFPSSVDHRHLGALAVHVDTDVDRHCRVSFPELVLSPGASRYRAELGRGPALIGSDEYVLHVRRCISQPVT